MVALSWSSSRLSCGERLLLSCDGIAGTSFPTKQGKDPSSPATRRKRALLDVGRSLVLPLEFRRVCRVNSRVAVRLRRTLWTLQRLGVISVETPQQKWASSRLEGRTSWNFSSCCMCWRLTIGTSGTSSGDLRKGQSPCELLQGLSGFLSLRCRGQRPCVESGLEPEDSSPVLTWILA